MLGECQQQRCQLRKRGVIWKCSPELRVSLVSLGMTGTNRDGRQLILGGVSMTGVMYIGGVSYRVLAEIGKCQLKESHLG